MNIPVRHATAATKLAIVDCDIHPAFRKPSDLYPFLPTQWREHMITFGEHLRQGLSGQLAWPRMIGVGPARRRLSRGRPAGFRSRADAAPASRCQRRRIRHADAAFQGRHGGAQSGVRRRPVARRQRLAVGNLRQAGAAAPRRHRGAAGGRGLRGQRDRAPRGRSVVCADHHLAAVERSARSPALLADLRGRAALQPPDRAARRRASAAVMPRPRRAGRPITWRSTTPRPPACRTR